MNTFLHEADTIVTDEKKLSVPSQRTNWEEIKELDIIMRLRVATGNAWTKGVGLAAVQIGLYLRVAWFADGGKEYVLVNPRITRAEQRIVVPREGCLSIPDRWSPVARYYKITVENEGEEGSETLELEGFPAYIAQHEIDHMNGILNLDRRYFPPAAAGRNDPCPCRSGKKYKRCCIDKIGEVYKPKEEKDV